MALFAPEPTRTHRFTHAALILAGWDPGHSHMCADRFPIASLIWQFLAERSLDKPYLGGLSSFGLLLLVLRFLQACGLGWAWWAWWACVGLVGLVGLCGLGGLVWAWWACVGLCGLGGLGGLVWACPCACSAR